MWPPFQQESVLEPPTPRRASTTKYGPVEQSSPLSPSAPAGDCRSPRQNTRNLSTKSSKQAAVTHTHTHPPTLAAADEHPEEAGEFHHHFAGRFGAVGRRFQLRNKKGCERRKELGSAHPPCRSSAGDCSARLLDAFLDARSRSKRVHRVLSALTTQMLV